MPKIRRKSIENDFLLIFFCMQSEGVAQSSILMILRHPLLISAAAYAIEIGPPLILPAVQMRLIATI